MRGKEASRKLRGTLKGITPAYAGKSQCNSSCTAGKSPDRILWEHWKEGSPPHVRGKGVPVTNTGIGLGITPAYAGKSDFAGTSTTVAKDHPRVCGEKTKKIP